MTNSGGHGSSFLVPPPRRLEATGGSVALGEELTYSFAGSSLPLPALERLRAALAKTGSRPCRRDPGDAFLRVELESSSAELGAEGYRLDLDARSGLLVANGVAGLSHGLTTLAQLFASRPCSLADQAPGIPSLEALQIEDRPTFEHRGVLLDISRNRVPQMGFLLQMVERLAALKINHLQLYTEHTFAYRGHEEVWRDASPMTAEEVQDLDQFCRARHIELTPNQNSFGHFHRWLVHDRYRPLAEVPDGLEHPFGPDVEPFSLCPVDSGSIDLLRDLYDQLLPNFTSERFNVGLDETFDLGRGRSAAACAIKGKHEVYLEFLNRVHRLVAKRGRGMQYWGDIVLEQPQLVSRLPKDSTCLVWGYEAEHPFDQQTEKFATSGVDFWVCPGTSSWLSFGGRTENALGNLENAASAGAKHGASGYLITDWGDWGHLQPPWVSALGLVAGASYAWNGTSASPCSSWKLPSWQRALDLTWFDDPSGALSRTAVELGCVPGRTGTANVNGSVLFNAFRFLDDDLTATRYKGLTEDHLEDSREAIDRALRGVRDHRSSRDDDDLLVTEMEWIGTQMQLGCDLLSLRLEAGADALVGHLPVRGRRDLARRLDHQVGLLGDLWRQRSRAGGLERSQGLLTRWARQLSGHSKEA